MPEEETKQNPIICEIVFRGSGAFQVSGFQIVITGVQTKCQTN
jgi:hypothetical protein